MPAPVEVDVAEAFMDVYDCVPSTEMPFLLEEDADTLWIAVFVAPSATVMPFPSTEETEPFCSRVLSVRVARYTASPVPAVALMPEMLVPDTPLK